MIIDTAILNRIRAEAHRIQRAGHQELSVCYSEAIVRVIMVASESVAMDPFEARLVEAVQLAQQKRGGRGVSRRAVIRELELMGLSSIGEWTVSTKLSALAKRGLVQMPSARLWAVVT